MLTLPTQEELDAIKAAAEKVQLALHSPNRQAFNEALEDFHYCATPLRSSPCSPSLRRNRSRSRS